MDLHISSLNLQIRWSLWHVTNCPRLCACQDLLDHLDQLQRWRDNSWVTWVTHDNVLLCVRNPELFYDQDAIPIKISSRWGLLHCVCLSYESHVAGARYFATRFWASTAFTSGVPAIVLNQKWKTQHLSIGDFIWCANTASRSGLAANISTIRFSYQQVAQSRTALKSLKWTFTILGVRKGLGAFGQNPLPFLPG